MADRENMLTLFSSAYGLGVTWTNTRLCKAYWCNGFDEAVGLTMFTSNVMCEMDRSLPSSVAGVARRCDNAPGKLDSGIFGNLIAGFTAVPISGMDKLCRGGHCRVTLEPSRWRGNSILLRECACVCVSRDEERKDQSSYLILFKICVVAADVVVVVAVVVVAVVTMIVADSHPTIEWTDAPVLNT